MSDVVIHSVENGVTRLRLNDPATLNALSLSMADALRERLQAAQGESRAVVIGSEGRGFCSGVNLASSGIDDADFDAGPLLDRYLHPLINAVRDSAVPVVCAVRGVAAGIGASLALACDLIVAGESAYFSQAFRHIGLVPDGGSAFLLTRAVGRARAMELMLLGEKLPSKKALDWGLINRVVADEEVDAEAMKLAEELATGPSAAFGMIRRMSWAACDLPWRELLEHERDAQSAASRTADFREGVAAFLQKRRAKFSGR